MQIRIAAVLASARRRCQGRVGLPSAEDRPLALIQGCSSMHPHPVLMDGRKVIPVNRMLTGGLSRDQLTRWRARARRLAPLLGVTNLRWEF